MTKFRQIVEKILREAKQVGLLYHNTPALKEILKSNELKTYDETGLYFDNKEGWFNEHHGSKHKNVGSYYTLILDGDKLSENNKIKKGYRTENEFILIPSHQKPLTTRDKEAEELEHTKNWISEYDGIPKNELDDYVRLFFGFDRQERLKNERLRKNFERKHFDLRNPYQKEALKNFQHIINSYIAGLDMLPYPGEGLEEPFVLKNLNKYLVGLIVRYPFKEEISDDAALNNVIKQINSNLKIFKSMYPNLPIYLRDENGHKALLKNNEINTLPEIKTVEYPKNRLKGLDKNHEIALR